MPQFIDGLGREIQLADAPKRIVSLVPSQTELLYTLGLENAVVGITRFCVHPPHWQKTKTIIGGTKNINFQKILSLQPDLIIANKEENVQLQVEALSQHVPVWVSDVSDLQSALSTINCVGELTSKIRKANELANEITSKFEAVKPLIHPLSVAYLIWKEPYMTVGGDTFIHHLLLLAGFENVFGKRLRYPSLKVSGLKAANPDVVFLSSEPYPFQQKHVAELQALLPRATVLLSDGELLSWYGSRLLYTPAYLQELQHQSRNALAQ